MRFLPAFEVCLRLATFAWPHVVIAIVLVTTAACDNRSNAPVPMGQAGDDRAPQAGEDTSSTAVADESWELVFLQDSPIGYAHTSTRKDPTGAAGDVVIEQLQHAEMQRFGQTAKQDIRIESRETSTGGVKSIETVAEMGAAPQKVTLSVSADKATLTVGRQSESIPWPAAARGPNAVEQSLLERPMQPGDTRRLLVWQPMVNLLSNVTLSARKPQVTHLLTGDETLLPIELRIDFAGQPLTGFLWADDAGRIHKQEISGLQMTQYRTTRETALAKPKGPGIDVGTSQAVHVSKPIEKPFALRRAVYRIALDGDDPALKFTQQGQSVRVIDPHTIELTVKARRPPTAKRDKEETPNGSFTAPSEMAQSDDPTIVQMAAQAAPESKDAWATVLALESYVRDTVADKNFSTAMATAAEVAKSKAGDCTEHAVLLAALAKARGIPARGAVGLVYIEGGQAFGYHMWTEVFVDSAWYGVDGTLGVGGATPVHLKLGTVDLSSSGTLLSFTSVLGVLGRVKIEVVSAE